MSHWGERATPLWEELGRTRERVLMSWNPSWEELGRTRERVQMSSSLHQGHLLTELWASGRDQEVQVRKFETRDRYRPSLRLYVCRCKQLEQLWLVRKGRSLPIGWESAGSSASQTSWCSQYKPFADFDWLIRLIWIDLCDYLFFFCVYVCNWKQTIDSAAIHKFHNFSCSDATFPLTSFELYITVC